MGQVKDSYLDFSFKNAVLIQLREYWLFSEYDSLTTLLSEFQEATAKDILFMDDNEFLDLLKNFIEERRGMKYEEYEGLV